MRHVLIISLGPIQDFIAAARRCRDLWFGSWLLSDLSKAVAIKVANQPHSAQLIFPSPQSELLQDSETSVANKIVAIVPEGQSPQDVAEAAQRAMRDRLKDLATVVFQEIATKEENAPWEYPFERQRAIDQLEDLIEYLWVAAPIKDDGYGPARESAESLLAQRKRTMLWKAVPWEAKHGVPKSSLDGQRESVIGEDVFEYVKANSKYEGKLRSVYGVKKNERLCGVGLLKRLGKRPGDDENYQFLSTPHIATMPLLQRIENEADSIRPKWREYMDALNRLAGKGDEIDQTAARRHLVLDRYDGMLLIDTRLEEWFAHQREDERKNSVKAAQEALRKFYDDTKLPRPMPYFAVLLADGDNMGNAIRACKDEDEHRKLSLALDQFAQCARCIVETQFRGELIYSGGDDVLAFVPLNNVIECAHSLAVDFADKLKAFTNTNKDDNNTPTLSVGVAICHFIEPMGHALDLARKAEKRAKVKRDSLAIFVDKRSGPPVEIVNEWTFDVDGRFDKQLLQLVSLHRGDEIPDGVAHELLELESLRVRSNKNDKQQQETLTKLIDAETRRILNRKRAKSGTDPIEDKLIEKLLQMPQQLAERLLVTSLIAKAKDIAEGTLRKNNPSADKLAEAT